MSPLDIFFYFYGCMQFKLYCVYRKYTKYANLIKKVLYFQVNGCGKQNQTVKYIIF